MASWKPLTVMGSGSRLTTETGTLMTSPTHACGAPLSPWPDSLLDADVSGSPSTCSVGRTALALFKNG